MKKNQNLATAFYRVLRLRMLNPKISRCMFLSVLVVIAATAPLARLQRVNDFKQFPHFISLASAAHQVFGLQK